MPRRALRCVVDLNIFRVSAPGVWLPSREDVYLSISIFGQYRCTRNAASVFPVLLHQPFRFEKTYYTALDPSDVAAFLEDELVVIELLQYSDYSDGAVRLASFSCSAREFLYPYPTLCPSYADASRELLMSRTIAFPGISPKIEFSTKTIIKESRSPELDALEDALEEEKLSRRSRSRSRSISRGRSRSVSRGRSLSRTRSCSVDRLPSLTRYRSYSSESDDSVTSDPSYMRPTVSSIFRSKSAVRTSYGDESLSDTDTGKTPFVVRHLDTDLIGRKPGAPATKTTKTKKKKITISRPSSALEGLYTMARCPECLTWRRCHASILDCWVCTSYYKHLDRRYWGHAPNFHPVGYPCCRQVIRDNYSFLPVYTTKYVSDSDSDDLEVADLTSSRPVYVPPRPRSTSPYLYKPSYSDRFRSPSPYLTASERVDLAIERAKIRARARALSRSPSPIRSRPISPQMKRAAAEEVIYHGTKKGLTPSTKDGLYSTDYAPKCSYFYQILRDTIEDLAIDTSIVKNRRYYPNYIPYPL